MAQFATTFVAFENYLRWARDQGCIIQTGFTSSPSGAQIFTVVTAPSGKYVVIHDVEPDEAIPTYAYEYYTRRLGLESSDPYYGGEAILPFSPNTKNHKPN